VARKTTTKAITIDDALMDRRLLGAALGDLTTWRTWMAILKAAYARPLTKAERAAFDRVAGGRAPPRRKVRELIVAVSRRAGKGRISGLVAAYEAALVHHHLAPGERGYVGCISPTRAQSEIVKNYALGVFQASPILSAELDDATADEIRLRNGNVIATLAADYRSLRGRTLLLAIIDEAAFLRSDDVASPDIETARALLPGLATTDGMLMVLSSPFKRSGLVFQRHRDYFGRDDDDVLVVAGPSVQFNPTLNDAMIEAARVADPEAAASEWLGEFRSDLGAFLDDELIEAAIERARPLELPPQADVQYIGHADAAGGGGTDAANAYTISIGHREADHFVIDLVRGTTGKFDPAEVTRGYAALLREYKISSVTGDHFAPGWTDGAWRECGVVYQRSEANRSEIYLDALPLFARGVVRLPDHARLLRELRQLERHVQHSGKESVNHPKGGTDDFSNVVCGVLRGLGNAVPSLWTRAAFLIDDLPVPMPTRADMVFAALVATSDKAGVVYFSYWKFGKPPLIVLDYDPVQLGPSSLHAIVARLTDLAKTAGASTAMVFTSRSLANEFERLNYRFGVEAIEGIIADDLLAIAAAVHIGSDRVKIADTARTKSEHVPFSLLDASGATDDPLRTAALAGIAVALDDGRSLERAA